MLGLFGTALLYGDGMITPAISVLSAVEGLEVAPPSFDRRRVPIAVAILVGLFAVQTPGHRGHRRGLRAGHGGVVRRPRRCSGLRQIVARPGGAGGAQPALRRAFFVNNGLPGFLVLGSVFLVVTGGEALYADMGHFGRRPIALGWFAWCCPPWCSTTSARARCCCATPRRSSNPFYLLAPGVGPDPAGRCWPRWRRSSPRRP